MRDDIFQFEWNFTQKLADAHLSEVSLKGKPINILRRMAMKYSSLIQEQADKNSANLGNEEKERVTPHDFY